MSTKRAPTNEELLEKAVITADALATAGELPPEEANKFIDYVYDVTGLKGFARTQKIAKGDKWQVNKVGLHSRVAMKAVSAQDPGVRRGLTTSKVELETGELIVPVDLDDGIIETNIEGAGLRDHVTRMFATQTGNDMEDLWINGDVLGPAALESDMLEDGSATEYVLDEYLGMFDGLIRSCDSGHIVDAGGENMGVSLIRQAVMALPHKFRKNRKAINLLGSPDIEELWRERVSGRSGPEGAAALGGGAPPKPFGFNYGPLSLFEFRPVIVEHVVLSSTTAVSLRYGPITDMVVTPTTLTAKKPVTAFVDVTDYTLDAAAGTIARTGGGAIGDGDTVKVTYRSAPQMIMTPKQNVVLGVSRDVRIERARNIHRRVTEFVITAKIGFALENTDAVVKITNMGTGV